MNAAISMWNWTSASDALAAVAGGLIAFCGFGMAMILAAAARSAAEQRINAWLARRRGRIMQRPGVTGGFSPP